MSLLIRGGRVVDPASRIDRQLDLLVEEGRVARLDRGIAGARQVIDARDRLVLPGLVDMHVHLREPGQTHKEDIASGTAAAAAGGFTTVCCMPNTTPANDCAEVTGLILRRAAEAGRVRVRPIAAVSLGLNGEELSDFAALRAAGAVAFSDDGRCVMHSGLMRRALEQASALGLPVIQHCEDHLLSGGGAMNEGASSRQVALSAQPAEAESVIVARDVELVRLTRARYHVAHMSTAAAAAHVRRARAEGLPVSCEVTPHHFSLTDEACLGRDPAAKVNPPLRSAADLEEVKAALADGTVDAIATDHAPHAAEEKARGFEEAPFGISGLETALPLCLELWRAGLLSLERLVSMLTCNPARILGLEAGTLATGAPADVVVVDPDRRWVVEAGNLVSRGKNTPLAGQALRGVATHTLVQGRVVWDHEQHRRD